MARDLSRNEIKAITQVIISEYLEEMNWKNDEDIRLNLQEIYETVIFPNFECQLVTDCDLGSIGSKKILGKYIGKDKVVLIDKSLSN